MSTPAVSPTASDPKARQEYRDQWAKWWQTNAAKVDLPRLAQEPPQRGWTIISQMSTSRVYEIDRQGKERWALSDLQGPIDAQVLLSCRIFQVVRQALFKFGDVVPPVQDNIAIIPRHGVAESLNII